MKCCVSTDVGTWTNWLTFEPDSDYSPDAGTGLLSPLSYKPCYAEFYIGKSPSRLGPMLYLCHQRPAGAYRVGRTRRPHFLFYLGLFICAYLICINSYFVQLLISFTANFVSCTTVAYEYEGKMRLTRVLYTNSSDECYQQLLRSNSVYHTWRSYRWQQSIVVEISGNTSQF